jgi:hypothetical protein
MSFIEALGRFLQSIGRAIARLWTSSPTVAPPVVTPPVVTPAVVTPPVVEPPVVEPPVGVPPIVVPPVVVPPIDRPVTLPPDHPPTDISPRLRKPEFPVVGMWGFNEPFGGPLQQSLIDLWPATGVMNYRGATAEGTAKEREPVAEGHHAYHWLGQVERANLSRPNPLGTLVFRGMFNLVMGRRWTVDEVVEMARTFLEGIANNPAPNRSVLGCLLGDDFAGWKYDSRWDEIVERVHAVAVLHEIELPFYFSHHATDPIQSDGIYNHGAKRLSDKYSGLVRWLRVFQRTGAQAVFLPQFFPQAQNVSDVTAQWADIFRNLEACQARRDVPAFRVEPVIQASAYSSPRGPTGGELQRQLQATIGYDGKLDVTGCWLMSWTAMSESFTWGAESQWRKGRGYADVVGEFLDGQD